MDTSVSRWIIWIIWISFLCLVLHSTELNTTASAGDLSTKELQNITTAIVNDVQLGSTLKTLLNTTGVAISEPPPDPEDPNWQTVAKENSNEGYEKLVQPSQMRLHSPIVPLHEGAPFSTPARFQIYDVDGNVVNKLGTLANPWLITATIKAGTGNAAAKLVGTTTVKYDNGWANFTDLAISHFGTDFILDFAVTYPAAASFSLSSSKFSLTRRPLKVNIRNITTTIMQNSDVAIELELQDGVTSQVVEKINWRNHTWAVNVTLEGMEYYRGQMSGDRSTEFNDTTGLATLSGIRFTEPGMVILKIGVTSDPAEYSLEKQTLINIRKQNVIASSNNASQRIGLLFDADYDTVVGSRYQLQFQAMMGNYLSKLYPDIILNSVKIEKGSIFVTFEVSGGSSLMNSTVNSLCSAVENRTEFNFRGTALQLSKYLTVDGVDYHGSKCGAQVPVIVKEKETLSTGIIIAVAVVGVALLIMVLAVIYWRLKIVPKTQTYDINSPEYLNRAGSSKRSVKGDDKVDANVNSFVNETYSSVAPADTSFSTFRNSGESTSTRESKHEKVEK